MSDIFSKRKRSAVMAAIRSRGNAATELRLIALMRAHGVTGWRRGASLRWEAGGRKEQGEREMVKAFTVKPDFVFRTRPHSTGSTGSRQAGSGLGRTAGVAVFVDGCFWHGCPKHGTSPKANASFWLAKITGNKARDRRVNRLLRAKGWIVLRVWEHELAKKNERRLLSRLRRFL